jgi:hypothetical protein
MGHLEKSELSCPISSPDLESEIAANTGLNANKFAQRTDDCGQAGGANEIRTHGTVRRQSRSNLVSRASLPKTGILAVVTRDFCRIGLSVREFGSSETGAELQKPANSGLFCPLRGGTSDLGTAWLE